MLEQVTKANFEDEVINSSQPALVLFESDWCASAKVIEEMVDTFYSSYFDQLKGIKVNMDKDPELGALYEIKSLPQVLVLQGNKILDQISGYHPYDDFKSRLKQLLPDLVEPEADDDEA